MDRIGKWYKAVGEKESFVYVYDTYEGSWLTITFNFDNGNLYLKDVWPENLIRSKHVKETDISKEEIFDMVFFNKWKVDKEYG